MEDFNEAFQDQNLNEKNLNNYMGTLLVNIKCLSLKDFVKFSKSQVKIGKMYI